MNEKFNKQFQVLTVVLTVSKSTAMNSNFNFSKLDHQQPE